MQKNRLITLAFLPVFLVGAAATLPAAQAQMAAESSGALVVIRFNQARVYFDQQLYGAISKAVAVKPEVEFNVVSFAPQSGNADADAKWQALASRNTQTVVSSMQQMGVPASRIHVSGQGQPGLFDRVAVGRGHRGASHVG